MNRPCYKHFPVTGSMDEALQKLTHVCRLRPGLKLTPGHCVLRKNACRNPTHAGAFNVFWQCRECPGPIGMDGSETTLDLGAAKKRKAGQKRPRTGS